MSEQNDSDKKKGNNVKMEKIKSIVTGITGATSIAGSIATGNPFLALGGASAVFGSILSPILNDRREDWFQKLLNDYERLVKKIDRFDFEKSIRDPKVTDALIQTSLIAIKTHQEEKRKFLRNAMLNISQGFETNENMNSVFIQYVDELTTTHVRILKFLYEEKIKLKEMIDEHNDDPNDSLEKEDNSLIDYLVEKFPETKGRHNFYLRDLLNRGLVNTQQMFMGILFVNIIQNGVTEDGKAFLQFIQNPIKE